MTAAPFSDGVLKLALAPDAQRSRTLLKAASELYAYGQRHNRTEVAIYEELALQLMRVTPLEDRVQIARMLAAHPDTPPTVVTMLLSDEPEVAAPIIAGRPDLADVSLLALIAGGSREHIDLVAARPGLSPAVIEALVRNMAPERLPILLANMTIRISEPLLADITAIARTHPDVARALARRHEDVEDAELTDLFLDLDVRGRRRVLQALEILALRDFAARRPLLRPPRPDEAVVADLARAALSRDIGRVATHLSALLGIDEALARRLLVDAGGEPLAVALKASGLDPATTTRVILFSGEGDVRGYFDVKRLVELYETLSMRSASLLVGRWRGDAGPLPPRIRRHVPQTEVGTPVRSREEPVAARAHITRIAHRERG